MARREQLAYMLKTTAEIVKPLIDDITEEESMVRGSDRFNHIRWQTGHLIHTDNFILQALGQNKTAPESYTDLFAGNNREISDDPEHYPLMAALRTEILVLHKRLIDLVEEVDEAIFDQEIPWGESKAPVWRGITFLCMHDFYHAGQITHIRKALGRERPFR